MGNPVFFFEIMTQDATALRPFYRDAFGWEIVAPIVGAGDVEYAIATPAGSVGISGGIGTAPTGYAGHVTVYISVPDVAKKLEDIARRGGTKIMGPEQVPGGPVVGLFTDPQGNTIGLVQVSN